MANGRTRRNLWSLIKVASMAVCRGTARAEPVGGRPGVYNASGPAGDISSENHFRTALKLAACLFCGRKGFDSRLVAVRTWVEADTALATIDRDLSSVGGQQCQVVLPPRFTICLIPFTNRRAHCSSRRNSSWVFPGIILSSATSSG